MSIKTIRCGSNILMQAVHTSELENTTLASFAVSELIGFSDGEFVKECLLTVIDIVCPEKRDLFSKISLSARSVTRRIVDLSSDIRTTLRNRAQHFEFYAIALDESTESTDAAQVAIFVTGINATFEYYRRIGKSGFTKGYHNWCEHIPSNQKCHRHLGLKS